MPFRRDSHVERERASDGGNGGGSGIVLSMDMVSTSYYSVVYTVPVLVGSSQQNLSLQVDSGSSDLWIASKSCSSAPCSAAGGRLYDSNSSQSTGVAFALQYISGAVGGPVVWDQVQIGGYVIRNQALAAATFVDDEPLSYNFDGILGLALPSNSLIQQMIPASTGDAPDGATISSNLFSPKAATNAPSQPFFSFTFARPGFTQTPSLLGIGHHPPQIVPDPSLINYSSLVSESMELLFWKTTVRAITVYVSGQTRPVSLQSLSGAPEPTALLDSGTPLILTTPALANGIYGALGISPAADGMYYVPCATPLNMTITLDGQDELPLHPLDLTVEPAGQSSSQYCTGLIQTNPSQLTATSDIGDMVLGIPFMRNVYTVMAYQQPNATGYFNTSVQFGARPMLGLLGLTNATQALEEFNQVRVLKQPLGSGSSQQDSNTPSDGSQLSIGLKVLIGLVGFFTLSVALFALRCLCGRKLSLNAHSAEKLDQETAQKLEYGAYRRARSGSRSSANQTTLVYKSSPRVDKFSQDDDCEFGMREPNTGLELCDPWDPHAGTWRDTIIGTDAGGAISPRSSYFQPPGFDRNSGDDLTSALLMAHDRSDSQISGATEFGLHSVGMAGIGTAARGSVIDANIQHQATATDPLIIVVR